MTLFMLGLELNQIGHNKIAFVLLPELKATQKNQFGFLSRLLFNETKKNNITKAG